MTTPALTRRAFVASFSILGPRCARARDVHRQSIRARLYASTAARARHIGVLLIGGSEGKLLQAEDLVPPLAAQPARVRLYADASHRLLGIGSSAPMNEPTVTDSWPRGSFTRDFGGTREGTRAARDDAWGELLRFLSIC